MEDVINNLPENIYFAYDKSARKIASPDIQKEYGYNPDICKLFDSDSWTSERSNIKGFFVTKNQLSQVMSLTHSALEAEA